MAISAVYLKHGTTDCLVEAHLYDSILQRHLDHHQLYWKPIIAAGGEEHGHWDWEQKWGYYSQQLRYESFALEAEGETQGLMIVNTSKHCRLPESLAKHLVYVEYLEVAPWNRLRSAEPRRYKYVGKVLIAAAVKLSIEEGNKGRIGLHSLPQADDFYRGGCGMTMVGADSAYQNLNYFEMSEAQAASFMAAT